VPRLVLVLALGWVQLCAQAWDPVKSATGWAKADVDGSIAFLDPAGHRIYSWMQEGGGVFSQVDVSKLPQAPEKWVMDASLNAWVVIGNGLCFVNKDTGVFFRTELPHEVGDVAWDSQGIYLSYRVEDSLFEKKSFQTGELIWSTKLNPTKEKAPRDLPDQLVVTPDRTVLVHHAGRLQVDLIDGNEGTIKGKVDFTFRGKPAPAITPGRCQAGWWLDANQAVRALPASQVPSLGMVGLLLVRENITLRTVDFVPTGLSEEHSFVGMVGSDAVFIGPAGGLVFLPVHG
jgi:hypothetical protein